MLAHFAAGQLDSVMDREEVAHHIVDSLDVYAEYPIPILKLSGRSIGFLLNWKVTRIKDGIQRMIWQER